MASESTYKLASEDITDALKEKLKKPKFDEVALSEIVSGAYHSHCLRALRFL